jgi:hypothetical protein
VTHDARKATALPTCGHATSAVREAASAFKWGQALAPTVGMRVWPPHGHSTLAIRCGASWALLAGSLEPHAIVGRARGALTSASARTRSRPARSLRPGKGIFLLTLTMTAC